MSDTGDVVAAGSGAPDTVGDAEHDHQRGGEHEHEEKHLVLDEMFERFDALRVLRADDPDEAGRLLEELGGRGKVEQEIVSELSKIRPLWRADRFEEAHRMAMRSIEVLDRNGARNARMPNIGPLAPVAQWAVQQVTRYIVKSHQNTVVDRIRKLYERREANSVWGSPEHVMLRRARINAYQVEKGFKSEPLGLPTFLLGGAFFSGIASAIGGAVTSLLSNKVGIVVLALVAGLLFAALAWVVLFSAGVARRRIRMSLDQPLKALYETIGACGNPPRDQSYDFALYAIVFTVLAWVVVPLGIYLLFFKSGGAFTSTRK
jgi:hypothetical protein